MTVEPWEPVARGTIPRAERFTVQEALDLTAGAVHPGWDEGDAVEPGVRFYATREEHLAELFEALIERRVKVLNPMTLMPLPSAVGEALERAIIMPGELVRFARECLGIELVREATEAPKAAPTVADEPAGDDWRSAAREEALRILERDRARSLSPSTLHIAEEIARDWRERGIRGSKGFLSAATIKRHALKGITLGAPARRATPRKRGK